MSGETLKNWCSVVYKKLPEPGFICFVTFLFITAKWIVLFPQDCVNIEGPDTVVLKAPRSGQSNRPSDKSLPQTAQRFTFTQVSLLFFLFTETPAVSDLLFNNVHFVLSGVWSRGQSEDCVRGFGSRFGPRCSGRRKLPGVHIWSHQCWKNVYVPWWETQISLTQNKLCPTVDSDSRRLVFVVLYHDWSFYILDSSSYLTVFVGWVKCAEREKSDLTVNITKTWWKPKTDV